MLPCAARGGHPAGGGAGRMDRVAGVDRVYVSSGQVAVLVMFFIVGSAIFLVPGPALQLGGRDAWLAVPLAAIPAMWLHRRLACRYSGQSIVQYAPLALGGERGKTDKEDYLG